MKPKVRIRVSRRPGGQPRFDILLNGQVVEGGFWSRIAAEKSAKWWRTEGANFENFTQQAGA